MKNNIIVGLVEILPVASGEIPSTAVATAPIP
jgi:hypothetical protein